MEKSRGEPWEAFAPRHADPGLALTLHVARRCTGLTLRELGEAAGGGLRSSGSGDQEIRDQTGRERCAASPDRRHFEQN